MSISKRLKEIAKYVNGYDSLADIACDHGYLGIYAALNYGLKEILLTDINDMPLASAKENCKKHNLENIISCKLGNGLEPLEKDYDVISICGIGGMLMVDILKDGLNKIKKSKRLVLCPNTDHYMVREFLSKNGFEIVLEEIVYDYKYYQIIVCEYVGYEVKYSSLELEYGPRLLQNKTTDFINFYSKHLEYLKKQFEKIIDINSKEKIITKINEINSILL